MIYILTVFFFVLVLVEACIPYISVDGISPVSL